MGDGSYSLDSVELAEVIKVLTDCRTELETRVADLRLQMRRLHDTWDGLAAEAQLVAQASIDDGLDRMNAALELFTRANDDARVGYRVAWDANIALWRAVT